MRICKISEIKTRVGEQITGVSGTLTKIFPVKSGEGQYGPWTLQDGLIVDDTDQIPVTFANLSDMNRLKGSHVNITAKQSDKGINGLQVKLNSYKDKAGKQVETIKLHVTGAAHIDSGVVHEPSDLDPVTPAAPAIPPDADPEEKAALELLAKKKAERLAAEAAAKAQVKPSGNVMAKGRINQIINLYGEAYRGARAILQDDEFFNEAVATIFIALRQDNLTDSMPTTFRMGDVPDYAPTDPSTQPDPIDDTNQDPPSTWQEVPYNGKTLGEYPVGILQELFDTFRPKVNPATKSYDLKDIWVMNGLKQWKSENP